ncbi:MAG: PDZ domain-containing protein [Bryobacteraceae bacterium]
MLVRSTSNRVCRAATAGLAMLIFQAFAQPAPPPPPAAPPEPPRGGYKVMTLGGSVSYLGIGVKEILAERAKELKLKEEAGVEVTRVDANSPAEKAGLKAGDAVLEYQGNRVEGAEQFVRFVRETPAGRQVKLKIVRGGANQTVAATIGERQGGMLGLSEKERERVEQELGRVRERFRNLPEVRMPDIPHAVMGWRSGMLGIDGESVEDQLAEFFGVKEGVLVRGVPKDMPAAKAGIKAGDVIVRVEDTKVRSPRDISAAIRAAKNKKPLKVTLFRQKSEMTVDVQLDDERPSNPRGVTVSRPQDFEF